jgi:hypothetical protein
MIGNAEPSEARYEHNADPNHTDSSRLVHNVISGGLKGNVQVLSLAPISGSVISTSNGLSTPPMEAGITDHVWSIEEIIFILPLCDIHRCYAYENIASNCCIGSRPRRIGKCSSAEKSFVLRLRRRLLLRAESSHCKRSLRQ